MKKLKILLAFATLMVANSCSEEFLNVPPQDAITEQTFYKNAEDIRRVTASIYGKLWFDLNDKFLLYAGDAMPGDMRYIGSADEPQFYNLNYTENNGVILSGWRGLYRVIATANAVINSMPPIARENGAPESAIQGGVAEARFIRAVAYFFLTEFWKDVPIVENASEVLSSGDIQLPKNTQRSVYEFIRRDLEFAAANLPLTDGQPGRVTSWSAKGMLAKLHLTMASHLDYTDSEANFAKAREYAADVLDNSGLELVTNYEDLFTVAGNNNPESLFALQFTNQGWSNGNSRQPNLARNEQLTGTSQGWGGGRNMTQAFIDNLYENADNHPNAEQIDLRRKWIYMRLGDYYPNIHKAYGGYTYNIFVEYPDDHPDELFKGITENATDMLNSIKKYVIGTPDDIGATYNNQDLPLNQSILRLADVCLVYAEAAIGTGTSTTDAKALDYYNRVRTRAGLPARVGTLTLEQVLSERRVEFGMESINWFDVKRRYYRNNQAAIDHLNNERRAYRYNLINDDADAIERNTMEAYELTEETAIVATPEKMNLPIPIAEITVNPKLAPGAEAIDYTFSEE